MSDSKYVVAGMDGWLNVKREPSGALPEFTTFERAHTGKPGHASHVKR